VKFNGGTVNPDAFCKIQLDYYSSADQNDYISTEFSPEIVSIGDAWVSVFLEGSVPTGATHVSLGVTLNSDNVDSIYADACVWDLVTGGDNTVPTGLQFRAIQTGPGLSGDVEPIWPVLEGQTVNDNQVVWEAFEGSTVTWEAHPLLVSGTTEPIWPEVPGALIEDGDLTWECTRMSIEDKNCPHTREVAIAASKIFAGDYDVVRFSATLNPRDWTTQEDAGFLPTGLQQEGEVGVSAIGVYRGNLVVWSDSNVQVWQVDPDPVVMALLDSMEGVGSNDTKAVQPVANDLLFLAALGIRTVGIAVGSTNLATGDAGVPIDLLIQEDTDDTIDPLATFYPSQGQYWMALPSYTESTPGAIPPPTDPLPPENDITFSSTVYPLDVAEEAKVTGDVTSGFIFPLDVNLLDVTGDITAGLLDVVRTFGSFDTDDESLDVTGDVTAGVLVQVRTFGAFTADTEELAVSGDVVGGALDFVTNYIDFASEESLNVTGAITGGDLTVV
jgi:hypothetical protein